MVEFNDIKFKQQSENFGEIKAGLQASDLEMENNDAFRSIFNKLDGENGDGVIDQTELATFQQKIVEYAKHGRDKVFSKNEAKKMLTEMGLDAQVKVEDFFKFINKLSEKSKNIKGFKESNGSKIITYDDGHTEEIKNDGTRITTVKDDDTETITIKNADGTEEQKKVTKNIEGGKSETIYMNGILDKETITLEDKVQVTTYKDEKPEKTVVDTNDGLQHAEYSYNDAGKPFLTKQIIRNENGTVTTLTINGDIKTQEIVGENNELQSKIVQNGDKVVKRIEVQKGENGEKFKHDIEYGEGNDLTDNIFVDGKKRAQQKIIDGKQYVVNYDGEGNTLGVILQNGESLKQVADRFGCDYEELLNANKSSLKGKKYLPVGTEIVIPGEMDAKKFQEINSKRQTREQAIQAYEEDSHYKAMGLKNYKGRGEEISYGGETYTVIGQMKNRERKLVKNSKGQLFVAAKDGTILKQEYAEATYAYDTGKATARPGDTRGRKTVGNYVFSADGKLLKNDYVEMTDTIDAGGGINVKSSNNKYRCVVGKDGHANYFDEVGNMVTDKNIISQINNAEAKRISDEVYAGADYTWGTDEERIAQGVNDIYSPDIMKLVNSNLEAKGYKSTKDTTPLESLMLDELSHTETREHIKSMDRNGAYGVGAERSEAIGRNIHRELKYEEHGGFGITYTDDVHHVLGMAQTRDDRLAAEKLFASDTEGKNEGSSMRQTLKEDGFSLIELDRIDAKGWGQTYDHSFREDQEHRDMLIDNLIFNYTDEESFHTGLGFVDSTEGNPDMEKLREGAEKEVEQKGYNLRVNGQDVVQTFIAGRTQNSDKSVDIEKVSAANTLLFKGEIPTRVKAEAVIYAAKEGSLETVFSSDDKAVYEEVDNMLKSGELGEGVTSVKTIYENLMTNKKLDKDTKIRIQANAIISGKVDFSDDEKIEFCLKLMHNIDSNRGEGASTGRSGANTNDADYKTEQLKAILQENPQILAELKEKVEKEKFSYKSITSYSSGPGTGAMTSISRTTDTKGVYKTILNDIKTTSGESIFYDKDGNKIEDQELIKLITETNLATLEDFRNYVADLKRQFKVSVNEQGALSDAANWMSEYSGVGTDRSDVANQYKNAKLLLDQLELAAQGKLRDSTGNVIRMQDLAKDVSEKMQKLQETNTDYESTINTGKMIITLAPVIAVTIPLSGGSTAAMIGGAVAMGGTELALNTLERKTSVTGDTVANAERDRANAVTTAAETFAFAKGLQLLGKGASKFFNRKPKYDDFEYLPEDEPLPSVITPNQKFMYNKKPLGLENLEKQPLGLENLNQKPAALLENLGAEASGVTKKITAGGVNRGSVAGASKMKQVEAETAEIIQSHDVTKMLEQRRLLTRFKDRNMWRGTQSLDHAAKELPEAEYKIYQDGLKNIHKENVEHFFNSGARFTETDARNFRYYVDDLDDVNALSKLKEDLKVMQYTPGKGGVTKDFESVYNAIDARITSLTPRETLSLSQIKGILENGKGFANKQELESFIADLKTNVKTKEDYLKIKEALNRKMKSLSSQDKKMLKELQASLDKNFGYGTKVPTPKTPTPKAPTETPVPTQPKVTVEQKVPSKSLKKEFQNYKQLKSKLGGTNNSNLKKNYQRDIDSFLTKARKEGFAVKDGKLVPLGKTFGL